MEGWTPDMIMRIDPTRFPVSEVRGSGGGSSGGSSRSLTLSKALSG